MYTKIYQKNYKIKTGRKLHKIDWHWLAHKLTLQYVVVYIKLLVDCEGAGSHSTIISSQRIIIICLF